MLTSNDLQLLAEKKITETGLQEQLDRFVQGFPFLEIKASASVAKGIRSISDEARQQYIDRWKAYLAENKKILKFVPTSGAASRMFKDLFSFLSASYEVPTTPFEKKFHLEFIFVCDIQYFHDFFIWHGWKRSIRTGILP